MMGGHLLASWSATGETFVGVVSGRVCGCSNTHWKVKASSSQLPAHTSFLYLTGRSFHSVLGRFSGHLP